MSLTFADFEFYAQDRSEKTLPGALNKKITMRKIRIAVSWIEECANMLPPESFATRSVSLIVYMLSL
jgi:hypothetical protein